MWDPHFPPLRSSPSAGCFRCLVTFLFQPFSHCQPICWGISHRPPDPTPGFSPPRTRPWVDRSTSRLRRPPFYIELLHFQFIAGLRLPSTALCKLYCAHSFLYIFIAIFTVSFLTSPLRDGSVPSSHHSLLLTHSPSSLPLHAGYFPPQRCRYLRMDPAA